MKKFIRKFFGFDDYRIRPRYNYWPDGNTPYDIFVHFVRSLLVSVDLLTVALFVMKVAGIRNFSWWTVAAPVLIKAGMDLIGSIANYIITALKGRYKEEYYREMVKSDREMMEAMEDNERY